MRYHVEEFTGMLIYAHGHSGQQATDFHVCDERGRTVDVFTNVGRKTVRHSTHSELRARAQRRANELSTS